MCLWGYNDTQQIYLSWVYLYIKVFNWPWSPCIASCVFMCGVFVQENKFNPEVVEHIYEHNPILRYTQSPLYAPLLPFPYGSLHHTRESNTHTHILALHISHIHTTAHIRTFQWTNQITHTPSFYNPAVWCNHGLQAIYLPVKQKQSKLSICFQVLWSSQLSWKPLWNENLYWCF